MNEKILTKMAQQPIMFFMFDSKAALLFLTLIIFQNLISVFILSAFVLGMSFLSNRGYTLKMALSKVAVIITGNKKYRFKPRLRKDHLFSE